jgi:hypothetical protein
MPTLPNYVKRRDESYQKWAARQRFVDLRKGVGVDEMTDGDMAEVADAIDDRVGGSTDPMAHVNALAALICEAQPNVDRASALHFLLNTSHGAALIARTTKKEKNMTYGPDEWQIIAKGDPKWFVNAVEKGVKPAGDPFQLTNAAAKAAHPGLSEARAFAKFVDEHPIMQRFAFAPPDPFSYMQGTPIEKAAPYSPPVVSTGRDAQDVDSAADAMRKLKQLAAKLRAAQPELKLTEAQAFARVYEDPANRALADIERRGNRPGAGERTGTGAAY